MGLGRVLSLFVIYVLILFTLVGTRGIWENGAIRLLGCLAGLIMLAVGLACIPESEGFWWIYLLVSFGLAYWARYGFLFYEPEYNHGKVSVTEIFGHFVRMIARILRLGR